MLFRSDKVYHSLLIPPSACLDELVGRFGSGILHPDGTLDRKALAALVFAEGHEQDLSDLNAITHRHILDEVRVTLRRFDAEGIPAVLVDAPQKCLLISWLQSTSAVTLEPPKIKSAIVSTVSPSICHEVMGPDAMILVS